MLQTVLASDSQWLLLVRGGNHVEKQRRGDNLVAALLQRVRGTECAGDGVGIVLLLRLLFAGSLLGLLLVWLALLGIFAALGHRGRWCW